MNGISDVIQENSSAFATAARVLLGLFLVGLGVATFFVPEFKLAFIGQLGDAGIPLQGWVKFLLPTVEGIVGAMLLGGVLMRIASLVSIVVMAILTYLHLVVADPTLLPLQFGLPLIPIVGLVLSGFLYFVDRYEEAI